MNTFVSHVARGLIPLGAYLCLTPAAFAQNNDFYKGKTITIVVGYAPGGGYDLTARLLARHIGRFIPGNPNTIVQNMPGAGSMTAVKHLDVTAPIDGTVMATFSPSLITDFFVDAAKAVKFSDFTWLGSVTRDFRVCFSWHTTGVNTWQDLMKRDQFIIGTVGVGTGAYVNGSIMKNVFGAKIKLITGYQGGIDQRLPMERGEIEGDCSSWSSINRDWIVENKIVPFVRFSPVKAPEMPDGIPFIGDFAKTQEEKDMLNMLIAAGELGRPFIMSKKISPERLKTLRDAFSASVLDEAFLADAEKQKLPVNPASGEEAERIISRIYSASPELVSKARAAIK